MKYATLALACTLVAAVAHPARAHEAGESTGVGEIKFGMSPDEVKKLYPSLELTVSPPPPTEGVPDIRLWIYALREQKLGKLTCNIDLKFLVEKLSHLDFYRGKKEDVPGYLEATYGKPSTQGDTGWVWHGSKVIVSYAPASGIFAVAQKRANDALQGSMFLYQMMRDGAPPEAQQPQGQQAPAQK